MAKVFTKQYHNGLFGMQLSAQLLGTKPENTPHRAGHERLGWWQLKRATAQINPALTDQKIQLCGGLRWDASRQIPRSTNSTEPQLASNMGRQLSTKNTE